MQVTFTTQKEIRDALKRLADSQERSLSQMIHVICKERIDQCREERQATGQTSLPQGGKKGRWDKKLQEEFGG